MGADRGTVWCRVRPHPPPEAPKKYPVEMRDRAIRLVEDLLADPDLELSVTGACPSGVGAAKVSTASRCGVG